jgi:hypothetical protein
VRDSAEQAIKNAKSSHSLSFFEFSCDPVMLKVASDTCFVSWNDIMLTVDMADTSTEHQSEYLRDTSLYLSPRSNFEGKEQPSG